MKMTGIQLIAAERQRQIEVEGFTPQHDEQHVNGELADAAAVYALSAEAMEKLDSAFGDGTIPLWPFDPKWLKISDDRVRDLTKAGALIAAEIDRLQRA